MGPGAWAALFAGFAAVVVAMPAIPKEATGRQYWLAGGVVLMLVAVGLGVAEMQTSKNKTTTVGSTSTSPTTKAPLPTNIAAVYLDSGRFPPSSGSKRIVDVPREIRGKSGYKTHPIAIRCPTNEPTDQDSAVSFDLHGRYGQFTATVRPFYPPTANQQSATRVSVGIIQSSNNYVIGGSEVARENEATPARSQVITAALGSPQTMILHVRCEDPAGTIVLTDARLFPS